MECYDDDFGTLKAQTVKSGKPSLAMWQDENYNDSFEVDGELTLRKNKPDVGGTESDFEDDFDIPRQGLTLRKTIPDQYPIEPPSPGSLSSPSRVSVSSSASSRPSVMDDNEFDLDTDLDLAARYKQHQSRLADERKREAALQAKTVRRKPHHQWDEDEDIETGLELEMGGLTLNRNTINKNVRPRQPMRRSVRAAQSSLELRSRPQIRAAKSMASMANLRFSRFNDEQLRTPRKVTRSIPKKPSLKAYQDQDLHVPTKPRKPRLIHKTSRQLTSQEQNGMRLNPETGVWEGNDLDLHRFQSEDRLPKLIQPGEIPNREAAALGGMQFDSKNLCWVMPSGRYEDDPFEGLDDLPTTSSSGPRSLTASTASTASVASSVGRPENSDSDVFTLSTNEIKAWEREDLRFMRKFGSWVKLSTESHAEFGSDANDLYYLLRMV